MGAAGAILTTSADLGALQREFVANVRAVKAEDPLAPVLVVVGSHLQHIYLRRLLARKLTAVANVRFVTLMDLAGELSLPDGSAGTTGDRPPLPLPLPDGAHIPLLEQVIAEQRTPAHGTTGLADTGMVHAVAATLRDLREGGIDGPLVRTASRRPWLRALAAMAAAYREALAPFSDTTRRTEQAASATPAQVAAAVQRMAPDTAQVLIYGIYDVNALQLRMLEGLARVLPARLFLPWSAAAEPFAFAQQTVDRLLQRGFRLLPLDDGPAPRGPRATRAVFSCADRQAEIEETVRRVLEDLAAGVPAGGDRRPAPHGPGLRRADLRRARSRRGAPLPLRRTAGAALHGRPGRPQPVATALFRAPPRRAAGAALAPRDRPGLDRELEHDAEDAALTPRPARWEALSKELGLVKGWDEFDSVLTFHREHAARGDDERAAESIAAADELHAVVRALAAAARRALEAADVAGARRVCSWSC